eukprot:CAMPEP_0117430902 /NCGR_PEP_ID=MMETSP0758-20121206/10463_1 /TAXON_ID=63605 /ORGANISM="Percolomonas cosmopolitus, Strain AE-1 (ATCC 50343)" /LENGTH=855 /DNA_ID=CAMNT_0005219429 /DNA_START=166 /DNA_END=2736 /DNA_ORIENTATION=+
MANLDPLGITKPESKVFELNPAIHGLNENESKKFKVGDVVNVDKKREATFDELVDYMKKIYTNNVAAQFYHLETLKEIEYIAKLMETKKVSLEDEEAKRMMKLMLRSEAFDHYLAKKFPLVKRYGLEGSEAFIPCMDVIFEELAKSGYEHTIISMPHRGRLNLLTDILKFPAEAIFHKMGGNSEIPEEFYGTGDVLSHLGISTVLGYKNKDMKVSLLNNPSHLEAGNPVALGKTRSKQAENIKATAVVVHGDSAICAQGVVAETFALCKLPHFTTQGTIHVIVNNQLGFTTTPKHYRSTKYSSDIAKTYGAPTFTVNAESIDDVIRVTRIAVEYKRKFNSDVVIELVGYRRYGHNELDEPAFTQPKMYENIRSRKTYPSAYAADLIARGLVTQEDIKTIYDEKWKELEDCFMKSASYTPEKHRFFHGDWKNILFSNNANIAHAPRTGIELDILERNAKESVTLPENFTPHERLAKYHIGTRLKKVEQGLANTNTKAIDWATAEAMAFGSLLDEGVNVRLSGQDAARGTFSQRHLKYIDQVNEARHFIFHNKKGRFELVSSPLSEVGVLGFEYGYSINNPNNFVIWEAQFGDFANCAQVILDTYISNAEDKWCLSSGITLLLPHGMDGAGPEHSSARLERFLQACNGLTNPPSHYQKTVNMFVINPTTPANFFHALRRQMKNNFRKPLIVMSPKILLRHREALSSFDEFLPGTRFQSVLPDCVSPKSSQTRIILCSGKIYYDLVAMRETRSMNDNVAIIRLEELSPFPFADLEKEVTRYLKAGASITSLLWVQEEHENQGAYSYVLPRVSPILRLLNIRQLSYVGRLPLSSSAVGVSKVHKVESERLLNTAFSNLS